MTVLKREPLASIVFLTVFGLCAYFYNGYGWSQTARYDAIWSFVEPGEHRYSFVIDRFVTDPVAGINTGDYALNVEHSPHYYANKAPGSSLLGVPAYFVLYHGERLLGLEPLSVTGVLVNAYVLHLWITVLPVAVSAVFFYLLCLALTKRPRRALLLTGVLYGGTLMLPFSTRLWGHTTAAAFVVISLAFFVRPGRRAAALCGLFAGLSVLTDYGAAPFAATLVPAALATRDRGERVAALLLGALGPLVLFLTYHWALFGSPLTLASSFSRAEMVDEDRVFGLFGRINPVAAYGLSFSGSRGLFFYMPVLLLSVVGGLGFARRGRGPASAGSGPEEGDHPVPAALDEPGPGLRSRGEPALWWLAITNIALAFLLNTTFNGWTGGYSTGPRYQIVALPFWVLMLCLLPERGWTARALLGLSAVSFANMFAAAAVSPAAPDTFRASPLLFCYQRIWSVLRGAGAGGPSEATLHLPPPFQMRDWSIPLDDPRVETWVSFNLGERLLGLEGALSLLPALLGIVAMATWAHRLAGRADARAGP